MALRQRYPQAASSLEKSGTPVHNSIFLTHHGPGGPAMHRRISTTLNTLRQDLAAKLGCDFIHHACRQAGHSWCDRCLLTPAANGIKFSQEVRPERVTTNRACILYQIITITPTRP